MIFAGIDTRGHLGSPLKIKGVSRDRFEGINSENRSFRSDL